MVPEGWTISTLPDVIGINGIITDGDWIESKDQDPNGDVRLIQLADIGDGRFINKSSRYLTSHKAKDLKCTYLHPGDILIARMPEPLGRACIFPGVEKPSISVVDVCIIHTGKNVDRVWLTATINSQHFRGEIVSRSSGTTRIRISRKNLAQIKILLPQFEEQQKIAAILSSVDDAIQATQAVIDQTCKVKQGLLQQFLTRGIGHVNLEEKEINQFPKGWKLVNLGDVTNESKQRNYGRFSDNDLYAVTKLNGLIPMRERVRGKNLDRCKVVLPTAFAYNPMRLNIGSIGQWGGDKTVIVSPDYVVFECDSSKIDSSYLNYIRKSHAWVQFMENAGKGSVRIRIYYKNLADFQLLLPPLQEQKQIVNILKGFDEVLKVEQKKLEQSLIIKRGLMHDLLTGRVRVKLDEEVAI